METLWNKRQTPRVADGAAAPTQTDITPWNTRRRAQHRRAWLKGRRECRDGADAYLLFDQWLRVDVFLLGWIFLWRRSFEGVTQHRIIQRIGGLPLAAQHVQLLGVDVSVSVSWGRGGGLVWQQLMLLLGASRPRRRRRCRRRRRRRFGRCCGRRRRCGCRHGGLSITWWHVELCARNLTEFMWPVDLSVAVVSLGLAPGLRCRSRIG